MSRQADPIALIFKLLILAFSLIAISAILNLIETISS